MPARYHLLLGGVGENCEACARPDYEVGILRYSAAVRSFIAAENHESRLSGLSNLPATPFSNSATPRSSKSCLIPRIIVISQRSRSRAVSAPFDLRWDSISDSRRPNHA